MVSHLNIFVWKWSKIAAQKKNLFFFADFALQSMVETTLPDGLETFLGIIGPPYCGIDATIRIGREMLCLPYAGFFSSE